MMAIADGGPDDWQGEFMALGDAAEIAGETVSRRRRVSDGARKALAHERAGRFRQAWSAWEELRAAHPDRTEWNLPLAASYLRFAMDWTSDGGEGSLVEAEDALLRGVSILTVDLNEHSDDVARLMLIARACEQRCILRAYGEGWTISAREALEGGKTAAVIGDARQILASGVAASAAYDLVALAAPSLAPLSVELSQSCARLAATLEAAGAYDEAEELSMRADMLRATRRAMRPKLVAIEGGISDEERTPPRRPALSIVTSLTA